MAGFVVAITGGIASGKSAVGAAFERLGIAVVDADAAARAVVAPGELALAQIRSRFGEASLLPDGTLDRAWLRRHVFDDPAARADLEQITHPPIRRWLFDQCRGAGGPYAMVAIPLLAETGSAAAYAWIARVLVIDTPRRVQRERLLLRDGIDGQLADRMIDSQASRERRLALASDIIVNDGGLACLGPPVARLDALYRSLAAQP